MKLLRISAKANFSLLNLSPAQAGGNSQIYLQAFIDLIILC